MTDGARRVTPGRRPRSSLLSTLGAVMALNVAPVVAADSVCYGTPAAGRLEAAVKLPAGGANFSSYSRLAGALGRTYVHSRVRDTVVAAYAALATSLPDRVFVYGETGYAGGGRFRPHRSHQNGLSVDFMVPVIDTRGKSVPLPAHAFNKYGYDIEFDAQGRYEDLTIDFEALARHLLALDRAAREQGIGIQRVIFDPPFLPKLLAADRSGNIARHISFMKHPAWIRHDEHYHVDFALPCRPLSAR